MSVLIEDRRATPADFLSQCTWESFERRYFCQVVLTPEDDGGYSALALRLPGVVSQGETEDEALRNIAEAFRAAVQMYLEDGGSIPWRDIDETDFPEGSIHCRIQVDV